MAYKSKKGRTDAAVYDTHPELPLDPDVVQPGVYRWPPHFTPTFLFIVFVGGCAGTAARYWTGMLLPTPQDGWPVSTLVVNLLGAFLLGFLLEGLTRLGDDTGIRRIARLGVGTGFMGAFTTYSTLAVESNMLVRHNQLSMAAWYIVISVTGGVLCSILGIWAAAEHHKRQEPKR